MRQCHSCGSGGESVYEHWYTNSVLSREQWSDRFWAKVHRGARNECWAWKGTAIRPCFYRGYPDIQYGTVKTPLCWRTLLPTTAYAHRVAWTLTFGPIPHAMTVDHICHNTLCCNPAHLRLLTLGENCANKAHSPEALDRYRARGMKPKGYEPHGRRYVRLLICERHGCPRRTGRRKDRPGATYCPACKAETDHHRYLAKRRQRSAQ